MYLVFSGRQHSLLADMTIDAEDRHPKQVPRAGRGSSHFNEASAVAQPAPPRKPIVSCWRSNQAERLLPLRWLPGNSSSLEGEKKPTSALHWNLKRLSSEIRAHSETHCETWATLADEHALPCCSLHPSPFLPAIPMVVVGGWGALKGFPFQNCCP